MAKAGFWLRGARGKLAGASAQKGQNGTILREIVTPRNPKTDKQIYQRAIMATVMKAYSAGKEIFDHAFQGVEKGQKSQQYFIAKNAPLLRSNIAQEINAIAAGTMRVDLANNACVSPKSLYAVPGAYMISEGTYSQDFFIFKDAETPISIPLGSITQDAETHMYGTKVSDYAKATGLIPGDIYTFLAIVALPEVVFNGVDEAGQLSDKGGTKQHATKFGYARFQVKADVLTNETLISAASEEEIVDGINLFNALFDLTGYSNPDVFGWYNGELLKGFPQIIGPLTNPAEEEGYGSLGIIRSRIDEDLRSTSFMKSSIFNAIGITSPYILPTWKKGTDALGTSELILESDN